MQKRYLPLKSQTNYTGRAFPVHKLFEDIKPNSFNEQMMHENFDTASGTELPMPHLCKGFVKPNGVLGKVKPRLIQHFGPEGSAGSALMNRRLEAALFRLPYVVKRSMKGTVSFGTNHRLKDFIVWHRSGRIASTDFGSFDASITDKATGDPSKPGLRRMIEKRFMEAVARRFSDSADIQNTASHRWQKKYKVVFDTFTLLTSVMIRCSGDGLASVGNYVINWIVHVSINSIAKSIVAAGCDWSGYTCYMLSSPFEALPHYLESHLDSIVNDAKAEVDWIVASVERESQGKPIKQPEHAFLMGEGDDKVSAYTCSFIKRFQVADARDKDCRKVLGLSTGYLYTMAGMNL